MNAIDVLGALRRGAFKKSFQDELRQLVDAVRSTGKKGTITVTLTVESVGVADDDMSLSIGDKIAVKLPQPSTGSTLMYVTANGDLSRRDPRQHDLEESLHDVNDRRAG